MNDKTMEQQVVELAAAKLAERAEVRGIVASRVAELLKADMATNPKVQDEVVRHLSERLHHKVHDALREEVRSQTARLLAQALGPELAGYAKRLVAALPEPGTSGTALEGTWMVVWTVNGKVHVTLPGPRAQAEEQYAALKAGWSEVYLARVETGPREGA